MKAIGFRDFGGPEVLELMDLIEPVPASGEALIRILFAGTGHGDCKLRQGALQQYFHLQLPKIPGRDGVGRIVSFGSDNGSFQVGDRVCFLTPHDVQGSCAQFVTRPTSGLVVVPDNIDTPTAIAVAQPGCCALAVVEASQLRKGETILVHGAAGVIGSLVVSLAKHKGAHVIAVCRSTTWDAVKSLGPDEVICFDQADPFTNTNSVDVVFDPLGGETHRRSYEILRRGGRLVYLRAEPIVDLSMKYGVNAVRAKISDSQSTLQEVLALTSAGIFRPFPTRQFPFENCAEAHRLLESGNRGLGRVILRIADDRP
jgi:NADPH:quinone reductase-like Zn-dependent oxidoreductase